MAEQDVHDTLVVRTSTLVLQEVRDFISRNLSASALPQQEENKVILAVDEAVTNIIEHGYEGQDEGLVEIEIESDDRLFQVKIRDSGKSFDPDELEAPDILEQVRAGKKKGLGIFLMRQIMDEVKYVFRQGVQNELILVKYIR